MSGLLDRIFPRSDASASEPQGRAAPATPPAPADESRPDPAADQTASRSVADLPTSPPPAGTPASPPGPPTGETAALPIADRPGHEPPTDQTAALPIADRPGDEPPTGETAGETDAATGETGVVAAGGVGPDATASGAGRTAPRSGGLLRRRRKGSPAPGEGAGPPVHAAGVVPGPPTGLDAATPGRTDVPAEVAPAPGPANAPGALVQSPAAVAVPDSPGFAERARLRRRLRYLRRLRELLLRDLGGFVFDARRFQRPREDIVDAKLGRLAGVDAELRTLEVALEDSRPLQELREPGIGGICDVCGSFFASTAKFCSECGSPATARRDFADAGPAAVSAAAPAPLPATAPPVAAKPGHDAQTTGAALWSTGAQDDQATPPSGLEPVSPAQVPAQEADAPIQPADDGAAEANGGGVTPPGGAAAPGGLARPEDESTEPPPMSSGDPLQQR